MEISFSESFKKVFKKRIEDVNTDQMFWERVQIFIENPFDARLKTHKLSGMMAYQVFLLLMTSGLSFTLQRRNQLKQYL